MIVKYNSLNRLEKPSMTLCNPGSVFSDGVVSKSIGVLFNHYDEEIVFNFNSTSELNFRIYKAKLDDDDENEYAYSLFRSVQNRRLIFIDDIGYFMITNVENGYDDGKTYKDVRASSIDAEIQQRVVPYIPDGTYRFSTDQSEENVGILERIVEILPLWTIGHVDSAVSEKWRTFEDVDVSMNCLAFLLEEVQEAYECIVLFDIVNRTINVYDQNNYVRTTNIHLTKDDLINSIDISENADDLYTAISVTGNDNVNIAAINPIGTNTIYNFTYYVGWMSPSLATKVSSWQTAIASAKENYYQMNLDYYTMLAEASDLESEISMLDIRLTMYQRCRDNIVAESSTGLVGSYNTVIINNGGTPITVYEEIADTLADIDNLIAESDSLKQTAMDDLALIDTQLESMLVSIRAINNTLSFSNYFTASEYEELCNYIFEGNYSDEYVLITDTMTYEEKFEQMKILYDRAESTLLKASAPTQEFTIDTENFLFAKEFEEWSQQLETGCLINVELDRDDIASLFLSNMTLNYDDHSLSMTFGNRFNKFDTKSLFEDALGDISKSANSIGYIKNTIYPIKTGELDRVKNELQTSRDLTMAGALASSGEEVVIDGAGYTGKRKLGTGEYDQRQIKITGRTIVFTDDAWETSKVAIGELLFGTDGQSAYGVNAETIIGDMVIGNNLRIIDGSGEDILSVVDNKILANVSGLTEDLLALEERVSLLVTQDQLNIAISSIDIDHVTTSTGYTFDSNGLMIYRSGDEIRNLLDNTGMYVTRSGDEILTANNEGVTAINLHSKQFLIIGDNSRFENYSNGTDTQRTACFYIGN